MVKAAGNRTDLVAPTCRVCKTEYTLFVNFQDVVEWEQGVCIQTAMPYLSAAERELLISGTCGSCFDEMLPSPDES
jgi:hypothetical protein